MAKNISIETSNGTLVLVGTKKATVTAKGGQLLVDLGNGETKSYPLSSITGWEIGTSRTGARADRFKQEIEDAKTTVTKFVNDLRAIDPDAPESDFIDISCDIAAALEVLTAAEKKAATHVLWLGKREERKVARDAKKAKLAAAPVAAPKAKRTRKPVAA